MADKKHNSNVSKWTALLDQLNAEMQNHASLDEDQVQKLHELRDLIAQMEDDLYLYERLDTKKGWDELSEMAKRKKIRSTIHIGAKQKFTMRKIWLGAATAASVLLVLSLNWYLKQTKKAVHPHEETMTVIHHDIEPGGNKAFLILEDGSTVELNERQGSIIIGQDITYGDGSSVLPIYNREENSSKQTSSLILRTPKGGHYQLQLADGTKVWINADSKLTYPDRFEDNERRVKLEGEAYFEVAHHSSKPFFVQSPKQEVKVLGTKFNINAYKDEKEMKTSLLEGQISVRLFNTADHPERQYVPQINQQVRVQNGKVTVKSFDPEEVVAWKNGYFMFDNEGIESIMKKIGRWYDVDIEFQNLHQDQRFTGTISKFSNVSKVLEKLELTGGVKFKIIQVNDGVEGRRIIVM